MDVDEDDDFYAPEEATPTAAEQPSAETVPQSAVKPDQEDEDLEEGEEEDEAGSDDSVCYAREDSPESADCTIRI